MKKVPYVTLCFCTFKYKASLYLPQQEHETGNSMAVSPWMNFQDDLA